MRPLRLLLEGFTSFRDEQEIDFTDLDLFAVWGPMGSGKSSILDAITYALYGKVERIEGAQESMSSLISHGQPRLKVLFEFECGGEALRVGRTLPRNGNTKVLLERREGDDWVSYGEGADRIKEVNQLVAQRVGFDYDAFTRSVVLPQGKFAEFLVGDSKKRRAILIDLLGLELYGRMSRRAGEIARDARVKADAQEEILGAEYGDVGEQAVRDAEEAAATAGERADTASAFEDKVEGMAKQAETDRHLAEQLEGLASELATEARTLRERTLELTGQQERADSARRAAQEAAAAEGTSRTQADADAAALQALEREASEAELAATRVQLGELDRIRREVEQARVAVAQAEEKLVEALRQEAAAAEGLAGAGAASAAAEDALAEAEAERERLHREHQAVALVQGLSEGDPCPVCERPLDSLPEHDAAAFRAAEARVSETKTALEAARRAKGSAETAAARAEQTANGLRERLEEIRSALADRETAVGRLEDGLGKVVTTSVSDALVAIEQKLSLLREAKDRADASRRRLDGARDDRSNKESVAVNAEAEVAALAVAISAAPIPQLLERVRKAAPALEVPAVLHAGSSEPAKLAGEAEALATALDRVATKLADTSAERRRREERLLEEALAELPGGLHVKAQRLADLVETAKALCKDLAHDATVARERVVMLKKRLETKAKLEADVETKREEHAVYRDLALELQENRIVDFLQVEALDHLAGAASVRLKEISDGRYRLAFEDDRYYVVDGWNGDEKRSVRTLSGGETFLASLALALALAEQVQLLAVTETARLDSLFLDEGFGSLDANTLRVVSDAIRALGAEDRMVGVITHVADLAAEMPVRLEVVKTQRGSTVRVADEALVTGA